LGQHKQILFVCAVTAACLIPFVGKAFSVDDPLFIWAATQIRQHPLDAYGFPVNWYGTSMPMWESTHNPPLASYYIAAVAKLFGMSEVAMHLAFLLPAIGAVLGTWKLATQIGSNGTVAAVATLASPAFLVSSTYVMCDVMTVCFFTCALALWVEGLQNRSQTRFLMASLLVAAAVLTKYFALSLLPLLVACTLTIDWRQSLSVLWLLVAVAIIAAYEWLTFRLYGTVHLWHAMFIAVGVDRGLSRFAQTAVGLSFAGGSFLPIVFFAPFIFSKRVLCAAALLAVAVAVYLQEIAWRPQLGAISYHQRMTWAVACQLGLFIGAGVLVLWLALSDVRGIRKQPLLVTFSLWIVGTFIFASYLNQQNNVRSMLPMGPAVGVLVARRLDLSRRLAIVAALAPAFALSLAVACADYAWANSWREIAVSAVKVSRDRPLWVEGHWGFQWYAEAAGARSVDFLDPEWKAGDCIAVPFDGADVKDPPEGCVAPAPTRLERPGDWVSLMSRRNGAGLHSAFFGPMPFRIAAPEAASCTVFVATKPGAEWPKGESVDDPSESERRSARAAKTRGAW
jgi:4-amino-4-deoxy-L-arabinose transferase-like glycosyltransferase